jgi:hypothetical protein
MLMRNISRLISVVILLSLLLAACASDETPCASETLPFHTERPDIAIPDKFELTEPLTVLQNQKVEINSDIINHSFQNCEVWIVGDDLEIVNSEFVNCPVSIAQQDYGYFRHAAR